MTRVLLRKSCFERSPSKPLFLQRFFRLNSRFTDLSQLPLKSISRKELTFYCVTGPPHLRRFLISSNSGLSRIPRGQRRQRTTFTHEQTLRLEMEYHISEYISRGKRFQLAELLDLTENQIKIWFQNRRAKDKRIEKAIVEQQFQQHSYQQQRSFLMMTPALTETSIPVTQSPSQPNSSGVDNNCSTCNYTKHHFESLPTLIHSQHNILSDPLVSQSNASIKS